MCPITKLSRIYTWRSCEASKHKSVLCHKSSRSCMHGVSCCHLNRSHIFRRSCSTPNAALNFPREDFCSTSALHSTPLTSALRFVSLAIHCMLQFLQMFIVCAAPHSSDTTTAISKNLKPLALHLLSRMGRAAAWLADCTRNKTQLLHVLLVLRLFFCSKWLVCQGTDA